MELELGLKITKVVDDISSANLLISKNRGGALFLSSETDAMFILTAHLNGYKRENIKIDIDKDGTKIVIMGEKPVQEMVMVGWKVITKDIEIRGFRKSFKIPDGVILDKIKARFSDDASLLTISIPKIEKGVVSGKGLEELEDEAILAVDSHSEASNVNEAKRSIQENLESEFSDEKGNGNGNGKGQGKEELEEESKCDHKDDDKEKTFMQGKADKENGNEQAIEEKESEKASPLEEKKVNDETERDKNEDRDAKKDVENEPKYDRKEDETKETSIQENQESREEKRENRKEPSDQENSEKGSLLQGNGQIKEEEKNVIENTSELVHPKDDNDIATTSRANQTDDQDNVHKDHTPQEKSKLCVPIVVGSALVVSFIVFVFHFIRSKNQTSRRRD